MNERDNGAFRKIKALVQFDGPPVASYEFRVKPGCHLVGIGNRCTERENLSCRIESLKLS